MTEHDDDYVPDLDSIATARDSTLAWDDDELIVRAVEPERGVRDEGRQTVVIAEPRDRVIRLAEVVSLRALRPWPALEIVWRTEAEQGAHRLVAHPRGVRHAVPRAGEVLASYERFSVLVEELFDELAARDAVALLDRGWLEDRVVAYEVVLALPAARGRLGGYRGAAETETLLAHTRLPVSFALRARLRLERLFSSRPPHDGLAELALSQRYVWVVKDRGQILRIPRDEMRGLMTDGERLDLVFGRSTFLSVSLPTRTPLRAALVDAAHEAADRLRVRRRLSDA